MKLQPGLLPYPFRRTGQVCFKPVRGVQEAVPPGVPEGAARLHRLVSRDNPAYFEPAEVEVCGRRQERAGRRRAVRRRKICRRTNTGQIIFRSCLNFSQRFFYGPFRCIFSDFFQSDSSAILFKRSENLPSEISHKIYIDKILNSFLVPLPSF